MKRTPLHLSAENDHYDIATALLKAGAAVNARDVVERTSLHLAAVNGHHNLATALLGAGATVNARDDQQWTPVHLAAMNGHHETVTALHKAGADVNARDNEEKIPLHLAANNGYQETVAVLLKAGSNVNTKNREQITPLHLASRDGDYETALALLTAGADANVMDKQKSVPLHEAALHGHPKCVEVLLQHGADIAVRNKEGLSTKDIAKDKDTSSIDTGRKEEVILGRNAILKLLQEESSRIYKRNKEAQAVLIRYYEEKGMTVVKKDCPVIKAAAEESGKSVEQVRNFINYYKRKASSGKRPADEPAGSQSDRVAKESREKMSTADPSDQGAGSSTWQVQTAGSAIDKEEHERKEKELCEAAKTGDTAKVKQLLDEGVNSQATSGYMKRTPLHLSAENDHYDIATALLKAGAAVNARDVVERTALHLAAVNGHHNLATALLRAGATVNAPADQQRTPVHLAAMNGHHETVTTLHKAGADVNARDNEEKIPLHLAANNGYQETVAVLLKAGSNVNTKNNKQRTSMHLAATNGHHETVTLLAAAQNADVNAQDSEQITPLHLASRNGDYKTALALLTAGADANVKDKQESVPLHEAALHGHPKCVEVLLQHGADIAVRNKEGLSTKDIAKDKDTSSIDTGKKEEVILGRKAILKLLQEESSRISNRNKEAQAVLIRYYEEKGMTVVKKDCPLIIAAAEESGKSVEQVRNFISNRKKRASSGKRPADEPAGSLSDTVAKESKDGAKKPRTQARVEDAEKPGCSFQGIETLMEGSIQDGASGSSTDVTISTQTLQSKQDISTSAAISVLLVNDEYGTAHGGVSTMSRGVARLLRKHGAQVYATALKVTEDDKRSAKRDGVELLLPEVHSDMPQPCLDWLNHYHMVHYPNIPRTLQYVVGHADVTSKAAKRIKEQSCQEAKLVLFNHEMPEDTAYFKTTKKAMQAPDKESRILEDAKSADAVFSVGPKIYSYFETNYKSLEEAGPRHYLFLPRASKVFENTNARPGGGQKVVLSFGRVSEVVVQKGHDLAARSLGYVPEHILRNLSWVVRGVRKDEDDWEKSRKILEKKMQKRIIKPTFRPFGTQEDIANDIKRAHLVLMTSRSEPFGLVGLEAIAAGIPVLISDQSGLADMIKDLSKKYKSLEDLRHRIVKTNVEESAVEETARRWADKITDTLEYSEGEFEKAAEFKKKLLESKYWEESNNDLLRVCGLIE
ncbi:PREDICTED: serine/threonine-protein phosphatase 6 regulatory ankyrin repeat subunit C-like [Branchiostoma belcheri]|uniref:Serine/threonine-protein phosphatase 6 regulatory ankyrin repeat subunit C-like n=1 Tax=Branchiostoma belcheri TaxID=7741 RepID=A0A6P4ZGG6_BRABE|nr:PREDICTED: serine/threonine-protein phosphatase 6 regulatory ankyrin repeat subunit C-like [Branchiostoma belcheri]